MFDSKKKMKVATGSNLKHKLSSKQRQYIDVNQCLLHLYTNQVSLDCNLNTEKQFIFSSDLFSQFLR